MMKPNRYTYFYFILIVLVNTTLKSLYAGHASFNFDEIVSVKNTLLDFGHIKHEAEWDNNPPFYYYCLWVWHAIFPVSEFNARLLSVLFVSFSIGLVFLFAVKHFNYTSAFYSAALLTFSNFLFYYSLEARAYSLVVFLAVASSLLFFKYLEKPHLMGLFALALINFLIIYSHYISGLILFIQYIFVFVYHKKSIKPFLLFHTLVILVLVFLRFTKKQIANIFAFNHKGDFWLKKATLADLYSALGSLFYTTTTLFVFIGIIIFFIVFFVKKDKAHVREIQLYCLSVGVGSVIVLFLLGTWKSVFLDRYVIFCIPFATLFVSYQLSRQRMAGALLFAGLMIIQLLNYKLKRESNMDYRAIAEVVKRAKNDNDYIIINTTDNLGLFEYYYDREKFMSVRKNKDSLYRSQHIYGIDEASLLKNLDLSKPKKLFLIQSFHKIHRSDNPIADSLSHLFHKAYATNSFKGVELQVFSR